MNLFESQMAYRQDIIDTLSLISSREEQLKYQLEVPVADVTAEIFCHWGDGCYRDGKYLNEEWCLGVFSTAELEAMAEFNQVLNSIGDALSQKSRVEQYTPSRQWAPRIEEFVLTPEWAKLSEAAAKALKVLAVDAESSEQWKD